MAENLSFAKQYETYPGKMLGNYQLERLLEQLETGPLFLARQTTVPAKQLYRLRFLALPAGLTPEERLLYLGHFQHEASQVAELQHPALLPLSDYGIFEGTPYLVSPDPSSLSLQQLVTRSGPVDTRLVGRYLDGMTAALGYLHQQGVFHLNLNPRNVFPGQDGHLLIAETGLVRMLAPQIPVTNMPPALELENGSPLLRDQRGRVLYSLSLVSAPAPELLLGQPPDASTDVYALGALLYYLLTGHRVQRATTLAEISRQHLNAPMPALSTWRQDLPPALDFLLSSALAKNAARRLRNPGALANAYAGVFAPEQNRRKAFVMPATLSVEDTQPAFPPRFASTPMPAPSRATFPRRRALALLAAGGGVALVAGASIWLVRFNGGTAAPVASSNGASSSQTGSGSHNTTTSTNAPAHSGNVVAKTADVPVNSAKTFAIANSNNPGILIHLQDNRFVAFDSTCTHAGCAVAYDQQNHQLKCPCHSATFDPARNAAVTGGPAPSPLTTIPITVNSDGTITTKG
ncbi:MAG TPA: Rieske 2Fe-2S domain-containing protein [Ktedonobacteraceae bacterium]